MQMKQIFAKIFIIIFSLTLASCLPKNNQEPRIKIVDLDGKSHNMVTKIPELNKRAMASQEMAASSQFNIPQNNSNEMAAPNNVSQNLENSAPDYGIDFSQSPQKQSNEKEKIVVSAGVQSKEVAEYDFSKPEEEKIVEPTKEVAQKSTGKKSLPSESRKAQKGIFVQVGSFSNLENAKQTLALMQKFHKGKIEDVKGKTTIHRVLLGPFSTKTKAQAVLKKITASGHEAVLKINR
jgi:cell division protein FtsN